MGICSLATGAMRHLMLLSCRYLADWLRIKATEPSGTARKPQLPGDGPCTPLGKQVRCVFVFNILLHLKGIVLTSKQALA